VLKTLSKFVDVTVKKLSVPFFLGHGVVTAQALMTELGC